MSQITITGWKELQRDLLAAGPLAGQAITRAAVEVMEGVVADAKAETPVDTGTLRASGHVVAPAVRASRTNSVTVRAGFGGGAAGYAIYVHERLDTHHPVGNAKFLERPFLARAPQIPGQLADGVYRAWLALRG